MQLTLTIAYVASYSEHEFPENPHVLSWKLARALSTLNLLLEQIEALAHSRLFDRPTLSYWIQDDEYSWSCVTESAGHADSAERLCDPGEPGIFDNPA